MITMSLVHLFKHGHWPSRHGQRYFCNRCWRYLV